MQPLTMLVSSSAVIPPDAPVAWTGGPPGDDEARVVWESLRDNPRYGTLVDRVAERLFRQDLAALGGSADVGFFRPLYVVHARRIIAALAGTLLRIGRSS